MTGVGEVMKGCVARIVFKREESRSQDGGREIAQTSILGGGMQGGVSRGIACGEIPGGEGERGITGKSAVAQGGEQRIGIHCEAAKPAGVARAKLKRATCACTSPSGKN